jgi:hypothetical protein
MIYPPGKKLSAADFIASEADAAEPSKARPVALGDPLDQSLEVSVPRHDDCCEPVANRSDNGIGSASREEIADVANIMPSVDKDLCH